MAQKSELENMLREAYSYIKIEYGLEKPESKIVNCSEKAWKKIKRKEVTGEAFYHPRKNRIYLSPNASLADKIHEYFGHALYSEQSTLGKKLKQNLELINKIEEEKNIPRDSTITIQHSENTRIEKIKENEYNIFCDTKNLGIQEYIQLKKETQDLFNKTKPIQEGFSNWIEEKILKHLGLIGLWEQRLGIITGNQYMDFYRSFLKEEQKKGAVTLLYNLGFPKSKDLSIIKKVAEENLENFNKIKYLIQYGSLNRDIDLMAVYPDNLLEKEGLVYDGCVDINVLSETSFLQRLNLYDIELVEPVFTGNLVIGDKKNFEKIKSKIKADKPSNDSVEYAKRRGLETFNSALFFYNQNKFKRNEILLNLNLEEAVETILEDKISDLCNGELLYSLNNLSFTLSYMLTAEHYNKEKSLIFFKDIKDVPLLNSILKYVKEVGKGEKQLKEETTLDFINETRKLLLEQFKP